MTSLIVLSPQRALPNAETRRLSGDIERENRFSGSTWAPSREEIRNSSGDEIANVNVLGPGLGATYDVHLRLIRKRVVDFILVLIKLFSQGVTVEALRAKIDRKSAISL